MKFHFDAFALCEIDLSRDLDGSIVVEDCRAELLGIFSSRQSMAPFVRRRADQEIADAKAWAAKLFRAWDWQSSVTRRVYVSLPIAQIEGRHWSDLEDNICAAALLAWRGYGAATAITGGSHESR